MKTLFYADWKQLIIDEQPIPKIADDEVLLKVAACGICGSELETFTDRSPRRQPPLIMGHEFCGVITETGSSVYTFQVGDRVISSSFATCGSCRPCERGETHLCENRQIFGMHRSGAYAEFVNVPASCLIPWPEKLPAEAACLTEPLANGIHVANLTKHLKPQLIVILGAGPIGLMCQQSVQVLLGASTIVSDLLPQRLNVAKILGARQTVNAKTENLLEIVREWTQGEGVDLVVDAVGTEITKKHSLEICRSGGSVVWIGLQKNIMTLNSYDVTLPEKTIFGSYAAKISELQEAVNLLVSEQLDVESWVQPFTLSCGVEAFNKMLKYKGEDIKAVLVP